MDQDGTIVGLKCQPGEEKVVWVDLAALQGFLVEKTQDLSDTLGKHVSVEDKIRGEMGGWPVRRPFNCPDLT